MTADFYSEFKYLSNHNFDSLKLVRLTGPQFDFCYVIKTRVGFEIAEMTRFLNYISSYTFVLKKKSNLEILENSWKYVYSEVTCLIYF